MSRCNICSLSFKHTNAVVWGEYKVNWPCLTPLCWNRVWTVAVMSMMSIGAAVRRTIDSQGRNMRWASCVAITGGAGVARRPPETATRGLI